MSIKVNNIIATAHNYNIIKLAATHSTAVNITFLHNYTQH